MILFLLFCTSHILLLTLACLATALIQRAAPPGSITITHGLREDPHSDKESTCQRKRHTGEGLIPASGRSPEGGHGNALQYFCPKYAHGQRSLASCSPWGSKEPNMTEWLSTYARTHTHTHTHPCSRAGLHCFTCALKRTASGQDQGQPLWNTVLSFSWPTVMQEEIKQTPHYSLNCLPRFFSSPGNCESKISSFE